MRSLVSGLAVVFLAALPAQAQTVKERLPACLACHGENGQSQNSSVPSLGAQQSFYVTVQLLMFREKMRVADPMNDMTKGLTDDDLKSFADIIAKLPPPKPAEGPVDEAVFLSDRVLVFARRPGRLQEEVKIPLPRPRDLEMKRTPEFVALVDHIWRLIEDDVRAAALYENA